MKRLASFAFFLVMVLLLFVVLKYPLPGIIALVLLLAVGTYIMKAKAKKQGLGPREHQDEEK